MVLLGYIGSGWHSLTWVYWFWMILSYLGILVRDWRLLAPVCSTHYSYYTPKHTNLSTPRTGRVNECTTLPLWCTCRLSMPWIAVFLKKTNRMNFMCRKPNLIHILLDVTITIGKTEYPRYNNDMQWGQHGYKWPGSVTNFKSLLSLWTTFLSISFLV